MITVTLTEQEGRALAYLIARTPVSDNVRGSFEQPNRIVDLLKVLDPNWVENCRAGNMLADRVLSHFKD